jgi:hypothetical protein
MTTATLTAELADLRARYAAAADTGNVAAKRRLEAAIAQTFRLLALVQS